MPIPDFNETGDLPIGVHACFLNEALARFGESTAQRRVVASRLQRIYKLANAVGRVKRFIVFGSFVTGKSEPQDVDIFLLMHDSFAVSKVTGESRLLFDHLVAQSHFGASVFWIRCLAALDGEQTAIEDWQIKRDGTRRGIIEVVEGDFYDSQ